jgi:two-component system phosphate regulon response regulator PhoB
MRKPHILIVEDEEDIQQLVSFNLMKAGFHVSCVSNGQDGFRVLAKEKIDCVLLDIMLPGPSGMEICRQLKAGVEFSSIPVVMMTAKREEDEVVAGLEGGADDYITKPFSPKVLVARVKAALRRTGEGAANTPAAEEIISVKDLKIFPGRHEVFADGQKIELTVTEFEIIALLAKRPGWAFSRQQIIDAVRGYDYTVTPRMIDVQVFNLRKKLGETGQIIETVRGIGYRLKD